ncbi:ATP-binding protein [Luedemannella flava]
MENALRFSPSTTSVRVSGAFADGYTLEIEDSGFGMPEATRFATNIDLAAGSGGAVAVGGRLGVAVAARLAQRQGIEVRLRESPHGGTVATIVLPAALLAPAGSVTRPPRRAARRPAVRCRAPGPGRHRPAAGAARPAAASPRLRPPALLSPGRATPSACAPPPR